MIRDAESILVMLKNSAGSAHNVKLKVNKLTFQITRRLIPVLSVVVVPIIALIVSS